MAKIAIQAKKKWLLSVGILGLRDHLGQLDDGIGLHFFLDAGTLMSDGMRAGSEHHGDQLYRLTADQQIQHFPFAFGQSAQPSDNLEFFVLSPAVLCVQAERIFNASKQAVLFEGLFNEVYR